MMCLLCHYATFLRQFLQASHAPSRLIFDGSDPMKNENISTPILLILALWAAFVLMLGSIGTFMVEPDEPPLTLLVYIIGPPILFIIAYAFSDRVHAISHTIDLRLLTALQAWRIVGVMFLVLMHFDLLPGLFAWPAGVGDVIVGVYAPFVVLAIAKQTPGWHSHAILLNILGLLDFGIAVTGGLLSSTSMAGILAGPVTSDIMTQLPLVMIPTFFVPCWIIIHIISLIQLRETAPITQRKAPTGGGKMPQAGAGI